MPAGMVRVLSPEALTFSAEVLMLAVEVRLWARASEQE